MPQASLISKLQVYRKILVQEFIREFNFLIDVAAGRATAKGDFTDKISAILKVGASNVLGNLNAPGISLLDTVIEMSIDWLNDKRKEGQLAHIDDQDIAIEQEQLRILLECVALEASRRYELVMDIYLSDNPVEAIVPLAKTQVERMLEYVARHRLPLTLGNLLTGIIVGHSGAYVSGFANTRLTIKDDPQIKLTAEGLCGRPAFTTVDGKYWLLVPPTAKNQNQPYHKQPVHKRAPQANQTAQTFLQKLNYKKEALFNYGYTKVIEHRLASNLVLEPKYGYVKVPKAVITQFDYVEQPQGTLKPELINKINQHIPVIQTVTRQQIEEYLIQYKNSMSLSDYIRQSQPDFIFLMLEPNNDNELDFTAYDLSGVDMSDCILNGIKISGSLANTKFQRSYLIGADLSGVTNAERADFTGAHLENMNGQAANFNDAIFIHAHLHFANLQQAQLQHIQHLGAVWVQANLEGIFIDDPSAILRQQEEQHMDLKEDIRKMRMEMQMEIKNQNDAIIEIQTLIKNLDNQILSNANSTIKQAEIQNKQAEQLQTLLGELVQEKQNRVTFERYCHTEFNQLKTQTKYTTEKLSNQQEQTRQLEQCVEKLEQELAKQGKIIEFILRKLQDKENTDQLFVEESKTQMGLLQQDIMNNAKLIEEQRQVIRVLKEQLEEQLQNLQASSQEQGEQLASITEQAKVITNKICQSSMNENEFANKLTQLSSHVDKYVGEQKDTLNNVYAKLQELQTAVIQIEQQMSPAQSPVIQQSLQVQKVSNVNNATSELIKRQRDKVSLAAQSKSGQSMFKLAAQQTISTHPESKNQIKLSLELEKELALGHFTAELLSSEEQNRGLKIAYQYNQQTEIDFDAIFSELKQQLIENKNELLQNQNCFTQKSKDTLCVKFNFTDDGAELKDFFLENGIIGVELINSSKEYPQNIITLEDALLFGKFTVEIIDMELQIKYQLNRDILSPLTKLQKIIESSKLELITISICQEGENIILFIETQYTDDAQEIKEFLEENEIITTSKLNTKSFQY